ncbi:MAG: hypothetical protein ACO3WU_12750 [Ilumatobacteraceae bacterium]
MLFERWGATDDEVAMPLVGDDLVADARLVATRAITIAAPPESVFPWLRQMGFGRAGWYSYDWIDNLGRRSARSILPEWHDVGTGDVIPGGGPVRFEVVVAEEPRTFVLSLPRSSTRIGFSLAYDLRRIGDSTRLVSRVRARMDVPGGRLLERFVLGPGDGVMVRKQLLTLARHLGH